MAGKDFSLIFNIGGKLNSSFSGALGAVESKLKGIEKTSKTVGKAMMGMSATVVAGMGVAVKTYAQAESAMTDLKSSFMKADGTMEKGFEEINKLAGELGAKLPGSTAEFTKMFMVLKNEGISAEQILGGMGKAAAYLGVVMKMDYPEAAKFVAQLADATKVASGDMMEFMDQIQRMNHVGLESDYMLQGFGKMSAGMKTARLEGIKGVKAMAPLLAMLGNSGMTDGGSAGNAISKIMNSAVKSTQTAETKFFKEYGKHAPKLNMNKGGEFGGIDNLYKELTKLKDLTTQERNFYIAQQFGNDAETIQALNILIDKGQSGYNEMVNKMASQADLQARVNVQLGTLANIWDAAKGAFDAILISVGEALAPQLKELVEWLSGVQDGILGWQKENPELFSTLVKVAGVTALVVGGIGALSIGIWAIAGPIGMAVRMMFAMGAGVMKLAGFIRYLSGCLPLIITIVKWMASGLWLKAIALIKLIGTTFMWLGRIFLMNPIGLAITVIVGLIYLLYKNWDKVSAFLVSSWEVIKSAWSASMAAISSLVSNAWNSITGFFNSGIGNITATIVNFSPLGLFYKVFAGVMSYFGIDLPSKFTDFGQMIIQGLINGIQNMAGAAIEKAKAIASSIAEAVKGFFGIHSPSRLFMEFGEYNMMGLANGMQNQASTTASVAKSAVGGVIPSVSPSSLSSGIPSASGGATLTLTQEIHIGSGTTSEQAKELANQSFRAFEAQFNAMMTKKQRTAY